MRVARSRVGWMFSRRFGRLIAFHTMCAVETASVSGERCRAQLEETLDVPLLNMFLVGVDVDGEVEVIGDGDGNGAGRGAWGLEDVEALDDEDVGAVHVDVGVWNDVVGDVGVDGGLRVGVAGFDGREEGDEGRAVVGFGESFAGDEGALLQDAVRVEEAVRGHQVYAGRGVPA